MKTTFIVRQTFVLILVTIVKGNLDHCHYKTDTLNIGERVPFAEKCSWIICKKMFVDDEEVLSIDVEVNHPGTGCCLGQHGDMFQEGEKINLTSILQVSCCSGEWVQIVPVQGSAEIAAFVESRSERFSVALSPPSSEKEEPTNLVLTGGRMRSKEDGFYGLNTSEIMSSDALCSQNVPHLPVNISGSKSVFINNHLLVCGGCIYNGSDWNNSCNNGYGFQNLCFQLNNSSSTWTTSAPLNIRRAFFSLTKVGQELFVLGGWNIYDNETHQANNWNCTGCVMEIEKYSRGRWEVLSQKLTSPRLNPCTVYMETHNSLVVIGGLRTNTVEMLNLYTMSWSSLDPLPENITSFGCAALQKSGEEIIYVTGGYIRGEGGQSKVWKLSRGTWSLAGELQEKRHMHSMGSLNRRLLVVGGSKEGRQDWFDSLERMDSEGNWEKLSTSLSVERIGFAMAKVPAAAFPCL